MPVHHVKIGDGLTTTQRATAYLLEHGDERPPPELSPAQRARKHLLAEQEVLMQAASSLWLQRQIDRQDDVQRVLRLLAGLQEVCLESRRQTQAGSDTDRVTAHFRRVARAGSQAAIYCDDRDLNEVADLLRTDTAACLRLWQAGSKERPVAFPALSLHLWSYLKAASLDISGLQLTDAQLPSLCRSLVPCQELYSLKLNHNALTDAALPLLRAMLADHPSLSLIFTQHNQLSDSAQRQLRAGLAEQGLCLQAHVDGARNMRALDAALDLEVVMPLQQQLIGALRGARVAEAMTQSLPAMRRIDCLLLSCVQWTWPSLREAVTCIGAQARNLRALAIDPTPEMMLDDEGMPEADDELGPSCRAQQLSLRLERRAVHVLGALAGCRSLVRLALGNMPLARHGLAKLQEIASDLPMLAKLSCYTLAGDAASGQEIQAIWTALDEVLASHAETQTAGLNFDSEEQKRRNMLRGGVLALQNRRLECLRSGPKEDARS